MKCMGVWVGFWLALLGPGLFASPSAIAEDCNVFEARVGAQTLAEFVAAKATVFKQGLKSVTFAAGEYRPEFDPELRALGVDVVNISSPSLVEMTQLNNLESGFALSTTGVRWFLKLPEITRSEFGSREADFRQAVEEAYLARFNSPNKSANKNQLRKSKNPEELKVQVGPLTPELYDEWYPIYNAEVAGKPGGIRVAQPKWANDPMDATGRRGSLDGFYMISFRDAQTGELAGGAVLNTWGANPDSWISPRKFTALQWAAYKTHHTDPQKNYKNRFGLSNRTVLEAIIFTVAQGDTELSYGMDYFNYGDATGLIEGLMGYKVQVGMHPFPDGSVILTRLLKGDHVRKFVSPEGRSFPYLRFELNPLGTYAQRYIAGLQLGAAPSAAAIRGSNLFDPNSPQPKDNWSITLFTDREDQKVEFRTPDGVNYRRQAIP